MKKHLLASVSILAWATVASAEHIDIVPHYALDNGSYKLRVGSFDLLKTTNYLDGLPVAPIDTDVRVLGGATNPSPFVPGAIVTGDPGWSVPYDAAFSEGYGAEYPLGTAPPLHGTLSFNVVADPRLGRNLSYWDGIGAPVFGAVPSGEILDLTLPNLSPGNPPSVVTLAGEATGMPGFTITTGISEGFHEHTGAFLWGSSARADTPEDLVTPGIYLYTLQLEIENGLVFADDSFFGVGDQVSPDLHILLAVGFEKGTAELIYGDIVYLYQYDDEGNLLFDENGDPLYLLDEFGNRVPELDDNGEPYREVLGYGDFHFAPEMQRAADYVHANLVVPEPGSASLLLVGLAGLATRRRRLSRA